MVASAIFTVTRLGLVAKADASQVLVSAVDLKDGKPLPGVSLWVFNNKTLKGQGATDASGISRIPSVFDSNQNDIVVAGRHGSSVAFACGYLYGPRQERSRSYLYTDRPVYRPGQTVYFKGIVREMRPRGGFEVPAKEPVSVEIRTPQGYPLKKEVFRTSEYGSFNGEVELPSEASVGYYSVEGKTGELHVSGEFEVAEYRKPEYQVTVETDKKRYVRGETLNATVNASYYFGSPVQNAQVEWTAVAQERLGTPEAATEYDYLYSRIDEESYGYGEVIAQGTAETDPEGRCVIEIPTDQKELPLADLDFTVSVNVTDVSRKPATGEGSALVTRGDFYLTLKTDQWIYQPNQTVKATLAAKDYDGKPVPNIPLHLDCLRSLKGKELSIGTKQTTTDSNGKAMFAFHADRNGNYLLRVEATDSAGRKIDAANAVWVASESFYEPEFKYPDLEVLLDKKMYQEKDIARLLINTTAADASALLTVEGIRTFDWRPIRLRKGTNVLTLPVKPEWVPNVFVNVTLESGKRSVMREAMMKVSPREHILQVKVDPDKPTYRPRDRATLTVQTLDANSRPVAAEVSLGVVDESIYAIRSEDPEEIIGSFYEVLRNQVQTFTSFPDVQLGGDGKEAGQPVRKFFPDTALWEPSIITNAQGRATVEMTVPDTLGAWRATAKAHTLDTAVGASTRKFTCRQDLMVRLETPRFLTEGDTAALSAVVHNETDKPRKVKVTLTAEGLALSDATPQTVEAPAGGLARATWQATAKGEGRAVVTVRAVSDSRLSDAMQLTLPILGHGVEQTTTVSGVADRQATPTIALPPNATLATAQLKVSLTPTLLSGVLGSLEYLAGYPYGCIEQTMSRFLPDIIVYRSLTQRQIKNKRLAAQLPKMVQNGLTRIYSMQNDDGGWGWTEYLSSEPWMTAYVVYGLTRARQSGFAVEQGVIDRGRGCLKTLLADNNWPDEVAYGYYILAASGGEKSNFQKQRKFLQQHLKKLSNYGLACYALGAAQEKRKAEALPLLDTLMSRRVEAGDTLHWSYGDRTGGASAYASFHSDVETTAMILRLMTHVRPWDPLLPSVSRWFLSKRQRGYWSSTKDTAIAIDGLLEYTALTGELTPDYTVTLRCNGKAVDSRRFGRENVNEPEAIITIDSADLKPGDNPLQITKSGRGQLYYSASLSFLLKQENLGAAAKGLNVERSYERVRMRRNEKTKMAEMVSAGPASDCRSGELLRMTVRLNSKAACDHVLVECPLPAGCEVVERRPDRHGDEEWDHWWSDMTVHDEKVSFLIDSLDAGAHTLTCLLRAEIPGDFHVMPVTAACMYLPEVSGRSSEARLRVAGDLQR
ncbi:MAG: hypothetical protein HY318_01545 [Armatimonadetes bacterium]|nr:hypothetical protein [Armatimonadota bacterium]